MDSLMSIYNILGERFIACKCASYIGTLFCLVVEISVTIETLDDVVINLK